MDPELNDKERVWSLLMDLRALDSSIYLNGADIKDWKA